MRIALANANYQPNNSGGGSAHIGQFIENAVALGHEVIAWPSTSHPAVKHISIGRFATPMALRSADLLYVRLEASPVPAMHYAYGWRRASIGNPLVVWEFNTVPEYALLRDRPQSHVDETIRQLKHYGQGCDLAVCVSAHLADYVRTRLGIRNTLVVPNGSDPDVFRPDVQTIARLARRPGQINVVWIGSASIPWHNIAILRDASRVIERRGYADRIAFHIIGNDAQGMRDMPANVHYQGGEAYALMPSWLSGMDVGLVLYAPGPADYSSPLKLFDYLASGLACVSVEQPQVREIFGQLNQTDLLIKHDDATGLAERLIRLVDDPSYLADRKAAARKIAVDRYSWRRAVEDTFTEIDRLMAARGRSSPTNRSTPLSAQPSHTTP